MHLARMLSFEAGTRSGEDAEDLHKMRVATRRMRGAWRVFEGAYRPKVQRRYVGELRTIARALGEVRDIDVLLEDLDAHIATLPVPGRAGMEPLRQAWRKQREVARTRLIARLDSKQYRQFVEDYLDFTESPGVGEVLTPMGQPSLVRDTAGSRILAAYEHVRAYQTIITWADVPTLHALRIESKRLRYTLEYFSEVLPVSARRLIATVTEMQDHLGLDERCRRGGTRHPGVAQPQRALPAGRLTRGHRPVPRFARSGRRAAAAESCARCGGASPVRPSGAPWGWRSPRSADAAQPGHASVAGASSCGVLGRGDRLGRIGFWPRGFFFGARLPGRSDRLLRGTRRLSTRLGLLRSSLVRVSQLRADLVSDDAQRLDARLGAIRLLTASAS